MFGRIPMTGIDWFILCIYLIAIIAISGYIGRRQKSQEDYYLGGRAMPSWQVGLSITGNFLAVRSPGYGGMCSVFWFLLGVGMG